MCGIAGFISFNQTITHPAIHLEKALERLNKRGPDASGVFRDNNCELGHTRLSIIDTSFAANQPMNDSSGRFVLVFNGEIYNYTKLKKELEKKNIDADIIKSLNQLFNNCEMARYTPITNVEMESDYTTAFDIISKIDKLIN